MEDLKLNLHADGLAAVSMAKSHEETRYYLNGVYVTPWETDGETGVMMVATDSHVLATYFDPDGEASRAAIIDGDFTATMLKSGRSEKSARRLICDGEIGRILSVPRKRNTTQVVGLTLVSEVAGTFPDWQKVIDLPKANGAAAFTWSHLVIERICKMANRLNGPSVRGMDVFMPEANGPALFTFGRGCGLSVVAMPMRGDDALQSKGFQHISGKALDSVKAAEALAAE